MTTATKTANITMLARMFHLTTKEAEKKLRDSGLAPVNEVQMPSGRRFVIWEHDEAVETLARKALKAPTSSDQPPVDTDDLAEVKKLLQAILEHLTKPQQH